MRFPLIALVFVLSGIPARGQQPHEHHQHGHVHHQKKEGTPPPGIPRFIPHTDERAGFPRSLGHHPEPSKTSGGLGYSVGGGVPFFGHPHPRGPEDGTWGWDDTGWHGFRRRSFLGWSHGRKYQGGTGAYRADGPHIPDPIFGLTGKILDLHRSPEGE